MTIRDQLVTLADHGVRYVVIGGQAAVMRQAVDFSKDLDILIPLDRANAVRVRAAVLAMTTVDADVETITGRDFQQYIHPESGVELDVHLKILAIPTFEVATDNASPVDYLGVEVSCLDLPALYASKRTDRPKDAVHRLAIEDRLRDLVTSGRIDPHEVVLACCLDAALAELPDVQRALPSLARSTAQPLLQIRMLACVPSLESAIAANPALHPTTKALLALPLETRRKVLGAPARLSALVAKTPLLLPAGGLIVSP
jgi:hypothetical protein